MLYYFLSRYPRYVAAGRYGRYPGQYWQITIWQLFRHICSSECTFLELVGATYSLRGHSEADSRPEVHRYRLRVPAREYELLAVIHIHIHTPILAGA